MVDVFDWTNLVCLLIILLINLLVGFSLDRQEFVSPEERSKIRSRTCFGRPTGCFGCLLGSH